MFLNGEDVTEAIRKNEVSAFASTVSAIPAVREYLLDMQRELARQHNVIMDGRDIGTVVLPNADVKIYLTASVEERAKRRWKELQEKGDNTPFETVKEQIIQRDHADMNREIAPLRQAEDAVVVDTSDLNLEESIEAAYQVVKEKMGQE
jgi:cytidylate kinase